MQGIDIALTVINVITGALSIFAIPIVRLFVGKKINKSYKENFAGIIIASMAFALTIAISIWDLSTTDNIIIGVINAGASLVVAVVVFIYNSFQYNKKAKIEINKTSVIQGELDDVLSSKSQNYKFALDGFFAVSAIIVTSKNEFLLVKRKPKDSEEAEDIWLQPGAFYRTNQYAIGKSPVELKSFYSYLISRMEAETGLMKTEYEFIPLSSIVDEEKETFTLEYLKFSENYRQNKISPSPFLVQKEKADKEKTSGTKVHIDCFFAFKLKEEATPELLNKLLVKAQNEGSKYTEIKAFRYNYIEKMVKNEVSDKCYNDLYVILGKFLKIWRVDIFNRNFKNKIRYCTFNPENNTLWLRLLNNCNLACNFCLMTNREGYFCDCEKDAKSILQLLEDNIRVLDKNNYKLVITGGEPFLITNLFDIVTKIETQIGSKIKKISICTNGTKWRAHETSIKSLNEDLKNKICFVINLSGYNETSYKKITGADNNFNVQKEFIKFLKENSMSFIANVVMTYELRKHIKDYFVFWEDMEIKNIALSYSIQKGIDKRKGNGGVLSKSECLKLYEEIGNGLYPIESFDNIELMIPSCDECNCKENSNIRSIYWTDNNRYDFISDCLDKN